MSRFWRRFQLPQQKFSAISSDPIPHEKGYSDVLKHVRSHGCSANFIATRTSPSMAIQISVSVHQGPSQTRQAKLCRLDRSCDGQDGNGKYEMVRDETWEKSISDWVHRWSDNYNENGHRFTRCSMGDDSWRPKYRAQWRYLMALRDLVTHLAVDSIGNQCIKAIPWRTEQR
jgi:hypothetical protein